jgi:tripartite-type tricarboxylate transporter receptor subunit TctC
MMANRNDLAPASHFYLGMLCLILPLMGAVPVYADYPEKPITLVLPYPVTGSAEIAGAPAINKVLRAMQSHAVPPITDILASQLQLEVPSVLGQPLVLERRPRARSLEGMRNVAHAIPDGYRLLLSGSDNWPLYSRLTTNKALMPAALFVRMPVALIAHDRFAADSVHELVRLARSRPGQLNFGTAGEFSIGHLTGELFKTAAGIDIVHVSFNGGTAALNALAKRQIDIAFVALAAALPYMGNGKLKLLGLADRERYPTLPQAPLIADSGLKGFEVRGWFGVFVPQGTPQDVIARISDGVAAAADSQPTQQILLAQGLLSMHLPAAEFSALVRAEGKLWADLIKGSNVPLQR